MVLHTIQELGIDDQVTLKNIRHEPKFYDELLELNGRTQVPCLTIDGKPMLESDDINAFLMKHMS